MISKRLLLALLVLLAIGAQLCSIEIFTADDDKTVSISEGPLEFDMVIQPYVWDDFPDQHELRVSVAESPDHGADIEIGQSINDIPYFADGRTVMVGNTASLFVARLAHIALRYDLESSSRSRRSMELLEETDGGLRVRWTPLNITVARDEFDFGDTEFEGLTLVFLYDRNLNDTVDEGEIDRVRVEF